MLGFKTKEKPLEVKRELSKAAKAILEDPAFEAALTEAEKRLVRALTQAKSDSEKLELVAKLQVLMQIAAELAALINDFRMSANHARRAGSG